VRKRCITGKESGVSDRLFPHREPCASCGQPHPARIAADGGITHRHPDGHAYHPRIGAAEEHDGQVRAVVDRWQRIDGYSPALFGALVKCSTCRALLEAVTDDLLAHRALCGDVRRSA
jgi:hypothetical protein